MIGAQLPVHFIPTSNDLLDMLANVERKNAAAREQKADERMARAWEAEARARHFARMYGSVA